MYFACRQLANYLNSHRDRLASYKTLYVPKSRPK